MDYATTLNIDQQGRIIIPAKVRKALQLHTGDVLMLEADTRNICLLKAYRHFLLQQALLEVSLKLYKEDFYLKSTYRISQSYPYYNLLMHCQ